MVDWLVACGVNSAVSFAFTEVLLPLAKGGIEDYTKDSLKEKIKGVVNNEHRTAVGKAVKEFLILLQDELQGAEDGLTIERIETQFSGAVKQFIYHPEVKQILGLAFGFDRDKIDPNRLAEIWTSERLTQLPSDFRWSKIVRVYREKVKAILLESNELRGLLDSQNLEQIQDRISDLAGVVTPNLDDECYRRAIRECYGYLRLNVIDSTDSQHRIKLWNVFIPQQVKEGTPPSRFELPKSIQQRLYDRGQLDAIISPEQRNRYYYEYLEKSPRSIAELLNDDNCQYVVILGDPGAGKSTWFHYLALDWVEKYPSPAFIPLLLELGKYKQDRTGAKSFLDFFHQSPSAFHKLNRLDLDRRLREGTVRMLFDGLDEVFDPQLRSEAIIEIISFAHQYPKVPIWVTSRIIGYHSEQFTNARFRHFTIQDFNNEQIEDFIIKWHELAVDTEQDRLKFSQRLQAAINYSPAIRELAGNPLLLTMMAILNLRQELPRDRANLYKQASIVLLHSWDIEYHELPQILDILDREGKQSLLKQIAYRMQSAPDGLAGNSISREDLIAEISQFLQNRIDKPIQIAEKLIEQLRTRNFILCYLGSEMYAFMHRTFLEYFCASYFVEQFEKRQKLTIDDLIYKVYALHWQDSTWHEVLRLIIAQIDSEFAGKIIDWLIEQKDPDRECVAIFLAAECLLDVKERFKIPAIEQKLIEQLKKIAVDYDLDYYYCDDWDDSESELVSSIKIEAIYLIRRLKPQQRRQLHHLENLLSSGVDRDIQIAITNGFACGWDDLSALDFFRAHLESPDRDYLTNFMTRLQINLNFMDEEVSFYHFQSMLDESLNEELSCLAVHQLAKKWNDNPTILPLIKDVAKSDSREVVRSAAVSAIAQEYQQDPDTWNFLTTIAQSDPHKSVRSNAIVAIAEGWAEDSATLSSILNIARSDLHESVRCSAVKAIEKGWPNVNNLDSIVEIAKCDSHPEVRCAAIEAISKICQKDDLMLLLQIDIARSDPDESVRRAATWAIANEWSFDPKSLPVLIEISQSDPDFYVRGSTIWAIAQGWRNTGDILEFIIEIIESDAHEDVRTQAVSALANYWYDEARIFPLLVNLAQNEPNEFVRSSAVEAIHENAFDRPGALPLFISLAALDPSRFVRFWAIRGVIESSEQDPDILPLLVDRAKTDADDSIRMLALNAIAKGYRNYPERFELLCDRAMNDPFIAAVEKNEPNPRLVALFALAKQYPERPETQKILLDRSVNDSDIEITKFATKELQISNLN
jgi:HEAT repeat protein/GTPase SAR1 family protein